MKTFAIFDLVEQRYVCQCDNMKDASMIASVINNAVFLQELLDIAHAK